MNVQFKKGVLELLVLLLVHDKDMYGYELVSEVSKIVDVNEGTIYPLLKRLTNEKYFETYPKIKGFLDGLVEEGKEKGYVTTMFGRRRPIPELKSGNFMQRSFGERVAMNSPIQGTAADIIKIAMNRVYRRLKDENLKSRLVLQVHDELLIETCKEEIPQVSAILEEEMKGAAKLSVELEVDMHQGNNWYEAK